MSINEVKTIDQTISKGRQSLLYQEVFKIGDNSLRINIKSDSYDFQCSAKVSWLDRDQREWNVLHNIHYDQMKTPDGLCYHPQARDMDRFEIYFYSKFEDDRNKLVEMAKALI